MDSLAILGVLAVIIGIVGVIVLMKGRKKMSAEAADRLTVHGGGEARSAAWRRTC